MYTYTPDADLYANEESFLITLDVPGVSESDIDVTVEGQALTLRAGGGEDAPPRWFRRFKLPRDVDTENIAASHADGVLTLTLPRAAANTPRRIAVNAS